MNTLVNASMDNSLNKSYSRAYISDMNIGANLDEAMRLRGIESQKALERLSGVPQPTINRILKGNNPDIGTAKKLADALGVSITWLIDRSGIGPDSSINDQNTPLTDEAQLLIQCVRRLDGSAPEFAQMFAHYARLLALAEHLMGMQDADVARELQLEEQKLTDHIDQTRVQKHAKRDHRAKGSY